MLLLAHSCNSMLIGQNFLLYYSKYLVTRIVVREDVKQEYYIHTLGNPEYQHLMLCKGFPSHT